MPIFVEYFVETILCLIGKNPTNSDENYLRRVDSLYDIRFCDNNRSLI